VNVLIGSVGYKNLGDLSFGPLLLARLQELEWPAAVALEDLSYGPIAIMQNLQDAPGQYQRAIFLSAATRDRPPGALELYQWQPPALTLELVQERINEGVTGVISLDNLLIICQHFRTLPADVICVEVEPVKTDFGADCSALVAARLAAAVELVRHEALNERTYAAQGGVCLRD
jgi:hydrogenase maturation protease